jgi:hypothetical protein
MICQHHCRAEECPNYWICGNSAPLFMLEFNNGVCNDCITRLGKCPENSSPSDPILDHLELETPEDCPVCFQSVMNMVKNPRCCHALCLSCFKAIYWSDDTLIQDLPSFPYSEQKEEEYYLDPNLFLHDPLVIRWKKQIGSWNENRIQYILENKKYLKHCPICRA